MAQPDPRRLPPDRLVQLLNSHPSLGAVLTPHRLRSHRLEAGYLISHDLETVDALKYIAWLVAKRHAMLADVPKEKPRSKLWPKFTAEGPRFG